MLKIKTNRFFKNLFMGFGRPKGIYVSIKQDEKSTIICVKEYQFDLREIGFCLKEVEEEE
ncbi:hypothetical protein [Anaerococcus hydrogenalis]|uniref:Uncharacterized protein n=1 Tax=Anaerococcus hydrogenalis ACS-025-V-Sch4 TaxID=879306 RepID=F0H1Q6_9FIRM|nr:hypothetical protein [Anaerococcus hydrogenalis]EGC83537.1 hypothetical protein HMPREF9246_1260 [Anaerococcus hydrogenalis ACS-025-V-Sch4]